MTIMYDSINVDAIPADATDLLGYTDGQHANIAALRTRFPNATIHTISAVGQVLAEWIDVEPGCVWPNQNACDLFGVWRRQGCKGYYSYLNNMQALQEAHQAANPGIPAEYFDADATGVAHVDPGYVATQYGQIAGYDVSDTTPIFEQGEPDMSFTAADQATLESIQSMVTNLTFALQALTSLVDTLQNEMVALQKSVAAIPTAPGAIPAGTAVPVSGTLTTG